MKNNSEVRNVIQTIFPERLYKCRIAKGWSQTELAQRAGTTYVSVSCYERGTRLPAADVLAGIAAALDVSADWLMGLSTVPGRR